jgi:succinate dehydrogenase / fumarate reductase membrane anchor subunit
MREPSSLRTPLKRARGLGSSHEGTHHFWLQRVSALALVPLSLWFMVEIIGTLIGADRLSVAMWLNSPLVALAMAALVIALFTHARMGVEVIIEDYVKGDVRKLGLLILLNVLVLGFGGAALLAIARLHFIGT